MPNAPSVVKTEISDWLKSIGKDRPWLAEQLKVSLSIVHQWLAPKGTIPDDRLAAIRHLMTREDTTHLIGDPEGNVVSFTLAEFERIEATRARLHYDSRPPMYRDAILAFIEADEARQSKITPITSGFSQPAALVAEEPDSAPKSASDAKNPSDLGQNAILPNENASGQKPSIPSRQPVKYTPTKRNQR